MTCRWASGSQACESAPCWHTMTSGPNVAASSGTTAGPRPARPPRPSRRGSGRLTTVPAAVPWPELVGVAGARETASARSRGSRPSARPGRPRGGLDAVAVVDVEVEVQDPQAVRAGPGRWPAPGRRRCRSPRLGRPSRGAGRRPGAGRARRRRAGSPRSPGASRRPRPPRPRACRRTAGRRRSPMPASGKPYGSAREALDDVEVLRGCGTAAGRRRWPARAPGRARRRPLAAGRCPARTGGASAGGPGPKS